MGLKLCRYHDCLLLFSVCEIFPSVYQVRKMPGNYLYRLFKTISVNNSDFAQQIHIASPSDTWDIQIYENNAASWWSTTVPKANVSCDKSSTYSDTTEVSWNTPCGDWFKSKHFQNQNVSNTVHSLERREENVKNSRNTYLNVIFPFYFTLNAQKYINNTENLFALVEHISFTFFLISPLCPIC